MTVPMIHGIPRDSAVRRTAEAVSACEKAGHVTMSLETSLDPLA